MTVITITNSEKMKMKNTILSTAIVFSLLSPFGFTHCPSPPPVPNFELWIFKNLGIIFASFSVFLLEHFDFLMFLLVLAMFDVVLSKTFPGESFPHFFDKIKQKTGNRFHPPPIKNTKPTETFQTKQT